MSKQMKSDMAFFAFIGPFIGALFFLFAYPCITVNEFLLDRGCEEYISLVGDEYED